MSMDEENKTTEAPPEPDQNTSSGSAATSPLTGEGIHISDVPIVEPETTPVPQEVRVETPNTVTITEIMQPSIPQGDALGKEKNQKTLWKSFLEKVSFNKRRKLDKIIAFVTERGKISNDDVEKLLKVSDATATRYLHTLEQEGKLRQIGKTGKHTHYSKI
jgi:ribosomal protein S25